MWGPLEFGQLTVLMDSSHGRRLSSTREDSEKRSILCLFAPCASEASGFPRVRVEIASYEELKSPGSAAKALEKIEKILRAKEGGSVAREKGERERRARGGT